MPASLDERRSLEQERTEMSGQITASRQELENGSPHKARRDRLDWQITKAQRRLAQVEARLAKSELGESHPQDH